MERIEFKDLTLLKHKDQVRFALFCAYQEEANWKDIPECVEAIKTVELWLEDKITSEKCRQVASIAYAHGIAHYVANVAAYPYNAASSAAYAASSAIANAVYAAYAINTTYIEIIKAQWDYYYELLHFEKNFEKIVLGVKL